MSGAMLKFLSGVLILAIIAVVVSKNAKAAQVIQAFSASFTNILGTVVSPLTTSSTTSSGASTPASTANAALSTSVPPSTAGTTPSSPTQGQGTTVTH